MDSDNDMEVDAVLPSASKGKEKAADIIVSSNGDTLPWYVLDSFLGLEPQVIFAG